MTKRPTAVTVIGWFFRAGGILGMVFSLPLALWGRELFADYWPDALLQLSSTIYFLWGFLSSLLGLLLGNGLLKGRNWARTLTIVYCVVATLIGAALYQNNFLYWFNLVGNLAFTAVFWFFLYRPHVNAFLDGEEGLAA
ncbi:MAG: hypothetical protein PVJ76_16250 [Gemmatimonadota bacterium]|jgi:hypothetical protein